MTSGIRYIKRKGEKDQDETTMGADVGFVPNAIGHSKNSPDYRYLAIREPLEQQVLPGIEQEMLFPFPTLSMEEKKYKLFGIVTNREIEGEELIHWHRKRCGKSEEAHGVMKHALAGGKLPRIINHSRQMIIQLQKKHPNFMLIKEARARILEMGYVPAG